MILFDLKCGKGHRFEAWFRDGKTYETQSRAGEILCPRCGTTDVVKAPMAPRVRRSGEVAGDKGTPAENARRMLEALRHHVEQTCDYVGPAFPEEARKIHYGETEKRGIYGEATVEDSRSLEEEGIPVKRLPWIDRPDS